MKIMHAAVRGVSKYLLNKACDHPLYKLGTIVKIPSPVVCLQTERLFSSFRVLKKSHLARTTTNIDVKNMLSKNQN